MREILPGVYHWTATHPSIKIEVSSYYLARERVLVDPLFPDGGTDAFPEPPKHIVLTNRHHYRGSAKFVDTFGCTVWASAPGMHEFEDGRQVKPFNFGDTLPGGIQAIEIAAICPDETALYIEREGGILAVADGVVRMADSPLGFVPDDYIGDDPAAVKLALAKAYRRVLDRDFDTLLLAHGNPWVRGAKNALREFVEANAPR